MILVWNDWCLSNCWPNLVFWQNYLCFAQGNCGRMELKQFFFSFSCSKLYSLDHRQVLSRCLCTAAVCTVKPVPSAVWLEIHTAPGTDTPAHDTCQTPNAATADRTSNMPTQQCSAWTKTSVVRNDSLLNWAQPCSMNVNVAAGSSDNFNCIYMLKSSLMWECNFFRDLFNHCSWKLQYTFELV